MLCYCTKHHNGRGVETHTAFSFFFPNVLIATVLSLSPISHPPHNTHAADKAVSQEYKGRGRA